MKVKQGFMGSLLIGVLAGILRIIQYLFAIEKDGFYIRGALASFSSGVLTGLLLVGLVWSILAGRKKKEQFDYAAFSGRNLWFILLGAVFAADGIYRVFTAQSTLMRVVGILCLAGALSWLLIGFLGRKVPGLLGLLPIFGFGGMIVAYFWQTYKYIQISEYTIVNLGLCVLCFFTMLLMKGFAGADCTRGRLTTAACLVLIFTPAACIAPLVDGLGIPDIFLACEGLLLLFLADITLQEIGTEPQSSEPAEAPDPAELNEYINNLPEVEEQENEQA